MKERNMPGFPTEPHSTYSPYKEPTVQKWLGHFVDKQNGGEVDLEITHKSGDTVTVVLADAGDPGGVKGRAFEIPAAPLAIHQDIDLSNPTGRNLAIETLIVKNVAQLSDGVTLSLLQGQQGYVSGPPIKIEYARPSRLPGQVRKLELSPYVSPPR
jgi:hypothetical protein